MNNFPLPRENYKVVVRCHTYNHEKYIKDALKGFSIQITNFPYCVLVIDDASLDNEQQVILDFMNQECDMMHAEVIDNEIMLAYVVKHKENVNCTFVFYLLKENHFQQGKNMTTYYQEWRNRSTYEALCEGDDFWVDSQKLLLQVEYMDANPNCGLTYTNFSLSNSITANGCVKKNMDGDCFPYTLTNGLNIASCTALYRLSTLNDCPQYYLRQKWPMTDFPKWIELSSISKLKYFDRITAIYRVLDESASHSKDINKNILYQKQKLDLKNFYAQAYGINGYERTFSAQFYECVLKSTYAKSDRKTAFRYLSYALKEGIISKRIVLFFLLSSFPFISKTYNHLKNRND